MTITEKTGRKSQPAVAKRHDECLNDTWLLAAQFMNQTQPSENPLRQPHRAVLPTGVQSPRMSRTHNVSMRTDAAMSRTRLHLRGPTHNSCTFVNSSRS